MVALKAEPKMDAVKKSNVQLEPADRASVRWVNYVHNEGSFGYLVSFTQKVCSRYNKSWKAVGMSIWNLSGKSLDADLVSGKL